MPNDSAQSSVAFMGVSILPMCLGFSALSRITPRDAETMTLADSLKLCLDTLEKDCDTPKLIGQDGDGFPPSETWQTA
jgi:hypothetical protein